MSSAVRTLFSRRRRADQEQREREFRPLSAASSRTVRSEGQGTASPAKPRYKVDLSTQQADCEANYLRLRKMLPDMAERDEWLFHLGSGAMKGRLSINVVDRAPYTTTLEVSQPVDEEQGAATALQAPKLTVCMYHDADMAEVIAWENHRRLKPRYDYPNRQMYQSDEKAQLNRFLADWLTLYQAEGRVAFDLAEIGLYK